MSKIPGFVVERWTRLSAASSTAAAAILIVLAFGPVLFSANIVDNLTNLFIYLILAIMWNALAGFAGLVSVGQQAFFGLGHISPSSCPTTALAYIPRFCSAR